MINQKQRLRGRFAFHGALLVTLTGLTASLAPAFAGSAPAAQLGSSIERSAAIDRSSVVVLDREAIESSGKTSLADLLRDVPFNSTGSPRPEAGGEAQSFAGLSLRGLGVGRTLVLLDGRRLPVAADTGEGQNLNAVPLAMVERIEVLAQGASAIYGSDAIGGVVNIVTRKAFTGVEVAGGISRPSRAGGDTEEGSIIVGAAGEQARIVVGAAYNSRDIVFRRDRDWSRDGASVFSNNFLNANLSFFEHPEFGSTNLTGCQEPGFSLAGQGSDTRCLYDFWRFSADEIATRNESLFARSSYVVNNGWTLLANAGVGRVKSFGRAPPAVSFRPSTADWPPSPAVWLELAPGSPNHPATPPEQGGLNPDWASYQESAGDELFLAYRFAGNGPVETHGEGVDYHLDLGMRGRVGQFDIDLGVSRAESDYIELRSKNVILALAQPQFDSGAYNIYQPQAVPEDVRQSFGVTTSRDARSIQRMAHVRASTELPFSPGAGPIGIAFGVEYRNEDYRDRLDPMVVSGNVVGTDRSPVSIDRSTWSVFGEALVPLADTVDLSGAVRYVDNSQAGTTTASQVALSWQPTGRFSVRASAGTHFRAPPLAVLGAENILPDGAVQEGTFNFGTIAPVFIVANNDIGFEQAREYRLGMDFEPFSWLSATLDLWDSEVDDRIALIDGRLIFDCLGDREERCPSGLREISVTGRSPDPALGLGVARDPATDILQFVQTGFGNFGKIETRGVDLRLNSSADLGSGRLTADLLASYLNRYRMDGGENTIGEAGLPDWRGQLGFRYRIEDFAFAWTVNHIAGQSTSLGSGAEGSLASWTTHDVQANWYAPWNGRLTLGIDNFTDKDPVLDSGEPRSFNFDLYDGYGRMVYLRYRQSL